MAPPYIVIASTFEDRSRPGEVGADAVSEFPPHGANVNLSLRAKLGDVRPEFKGHLVGYLQNIANFLDEPGAGRPPVLSRHRSHRGTTPPAGRTTACACSNSRLLPSSFWLRELIQRASLKPDPEQRIVFINAWNEWAEGCHLEPDKRYGRAWLKACLNARSIPRDYQPVFSGRAGDG